ncbi:UvrD-helicase domain-containing protein [Caldimonas caldifontis]|uniref:DNA 3'-5' helicase n=1 Tax=Caldimonas caldifontis TaxID=1452508 RepID=A0A2S5ST32_9BURK|nr:UvrD-helicase domain-containing protein [Caldimonas caldifontis]PPE65898.1 DNA helicase UvrD [Caldimonas caldifontis]
MRISGPGPQAAYRIDGRLVGRDEFYAQACDPRRSVVVEACAGAGKTWMLVSRILRALLDGVPAREILAITFTKKAAAEMRGRLMEWLGDLALADEGARVQALVDRGLSPEDARARAGDLAGLYERLLASGEQVEVRTFHAWFAQLMRAAPLQWLERLGLAPEAQLLEDTSELQGPAWREWLDRVHADPALREDLAALMREHSGSRVREWLLGLIDKRVEFALADAAGSLAASVPSAAQWRPAFAGLDHPAQRLRHPAVTDTLRAVARSLGAQDKGTARKAAQALEEALSLEDDAAALAAARSALLTTNGSVRKHLEAPGLEEAAAWLDEIQQGMAQETAHREHQRLTRLGRVLLEVYEAIKRRRGLADMADLERCALALLGNDSLAAWMQERLDARVSQVLIDEFQDTNPLQWQALSHWLSSYAGASGGASGQRPPGVFIVGDPKQSIYRFRRAEPRVFEAAKDLVVRGLGGSVLACDHTRRNAAGVIDAVNAVFLAAQAEAAYSGFRAHTTERHDDVVRGGIWALPRVERPERGAREAGEPGWRDSLSQPRHEAQEPWRAQEARLVADAIVQLVRGDGVAPADIQVLARRRAPLAGVAQALRERHIPCASPEDHALLDALEVRDLVALLDALVSPGHALSLAQALRSPIFDATDEDLVGLAQRARELGSWWAALTHEGPGGWPSEPLRRAARLLPAWAEAARHLPPHDLLDRIYADGDVLARYARRVPPELRESVRLHLEALLAWSLELDGGRYASPHQFVHALRRRSPRVSLGSVPDAVQLLTVHAAKGLEARVVFVIDTDPDRRSSADRHDSATVLVDWVADEAHPRCFAFVASERNVAPSLEAAMAIERAERAREAMNGLYVAMTRARERLIVSASAPHNGQNGPSWWSRLSAVSEAWVQRQEASPAAQAAPGAVEVWRLPSLQRPAVSPGPVLAPERGAGARLGEVVHRCLEWLAGPEGPAFERIDELARAAAEAHSADDAMARAAAQIVRRMASDPTIGALLGAEPVAWAGNEVPVVTDGRPGRIDRLVLQHTADGEQWWVLDYKIETHPDTDPALVAQLERYRHAIRRADPQRLVRAAFITGDGRLIEVIDSAK